jgi:TatD DNase family protein
MIDSHCHLADDVFEADLEDVVGRARDAGLTGAMCILAAGDRGEAARAVRVRALWDRVQFAVGVHPHQAHECAGQPGRADRLLREAHASQPAMCAVGEVGLDYHYDYSPRDVQHAVFAEQLGTARSLALPVVIHTREADDDTFAMLASEGRGVTGVFHCFTGGIERARRALDLGFYLSMAGILTFPKAGDLKDAAAYCPEDRLLVETDSPFLAPVPHRGKRNEPAFVARVVEQLATLRGWSQETTIERTTANFNALFGQKPASAR